MKMSSSSLEAPPECLLQPMDGVLDLDALVQDPSACKGLNQVEDWIRSLSEAEANRLHILLSDANRPKVLRESILDMAEHVNGLPVEKIVREPDRTHDEVCRWLGEFKVKEEPKVHNYIHTPAYLRAKERELLLLPNLERILDEHFSRFGTPASNRRLVDMGAGDGRMTTALRPYFAEAVAVEPNEEAFEKLDLKTDSYLNPVMSRFQDVLREGSGNEYEADAVLFSHSLYFLQHDDQEEEAMEWMARQLRQNGIGILVLQNQVPQFGTNAHLEQFCGKPKDVHTSAYYEDLLQRLGLATRSIHPALHMKAESPDGQKALFELMEFIVSLNGEERERAIRAYMENLQAKGETFRYVHDIVIAYKNPNTAPQLAPPPPPPVAKQPKMWQSKKRSRSGDQLPQAHLMRLPPITGPLAEMDPKTIVRYVDRIAEASWGEEPVVREILKRVRIPWDVFQYWKAHRNDYEKAALIIAHVLSQRRLPPGGPVNAFVKGLVERELAKSSGRQATYEKLTARLKRPGKTAKTPLSSGPTTRMERDSTDITRTYLENLRSIEFLSREEEQGIAQKLVEQRTEWRRLLLEMPVVQEFMVDFLQEVCDEKLSVSGYSKEARGIHQVRGNYQVTIEGVLERLRDVLGGIKALDSNHPHKRERVRELLEQVPVREKHLLNLEKGLSLGGREDLQAAKQEWQRQRNLLMQPSLPKVVNIAKKYEKYRVPLLDLVGAGNLGLLKAADMFDPDNGARFNTYAEWWIHQGIRRSLPHQKDVVQLGDTKRAQLLAYQNLVQKYMVDHNGEKPTEEEMADALGMKINKLKELLPFTGGVRSLGQVFTVEPEGGPQTYYDVTTDPNAQDEDIRQTILHEERERIVSLLSCLPPRERAIIGANNGLNFIEVSFDDGLPGSYPHVDESTYGIEYPFEEIGKFMGITKARVGQIHAGAFERLSSIAPKKYADSVPQQKTRTPFDVPLYEILPPEKCHALEERGICTIRDLRSTSEDSLREIPHFGNKTINHLKAALLQLGFPNPLSQKDAG